MKTIAIYDTTGKIYCQASGSLDTLKEPQGIPYLLFEIPERKRVVSVDTSVNPHVPIFEDIPKSNTEQMQEQMQEQQEKIQEQQEEINNLTLVLAELMFN